MWPKKERTVPAPPGFLGCAKCKRVKPESEFFYMKARKGFDSYCKGCKAAMKHTMPEVPRDELERVFWANVDKRGPEECWNWLGGKTLGYGYIYTGGRPYQRRAHRVSLMLHGIELPPGVRGHNEIVPDHLCGNKLCVNPAHIEIVTQTENVWRGTRKNVGRPHPCKGKKRGPNKSHC